MSKQIAMTKQIGKRKPASLIRNRCWACNKAGYVSNRLMNNEDKDSDRLVHITEKCLKDGKKKYEALMITVKNSKS